MFPDLTLSFPTRLSSELEFMLERQPVSGALGRCIAEWPLAAAGFRDGRACWRNRCRPDIHAVLTGEFARVQQCLDLFPAQRFILKQCIRSEEHTSELQSLMRISYAVFCLKKKKIT